MLESPDDLSLHGLDVEHFVCGAEAEGLVDGARGVGTVECHDTQAAAMRFGEAQIDQGVGEAALAILRFHKDIEHVAAMLAGGIERVGGPVEHQQAGGGDGTAGVLGNPAGVFAFHDHAVDPGLKIAAHGVEDRVLGAAHGGKHGSTMGGDEGGIGRGDCACLQHALQYNHPRLAWGTPYDSGMRASTLPSLTLDTSLLRPGLRLAVGVSGGADSLALLRALAERSGELGLVLQVAHLHHGLRGAEADGDLEFARALAAGLGLAFHEARVDTAAEAKADGETGKAGESIEEAARRLRYAFFRKLLASGEVDAVATAHTLDDQAETVLGKFLRGAWTEGLSGIHPQVNFPEGRIVRPLLGATRAEVEAYLRSLGQEWREDSSNRDAAYTRNRIRHELLPLLQGWNPRLKEHLAQIAVLARDEDSWWQAELARTPQLVMAGRPVRGGGRAAGEGLAIDVTRLAALHPALQRRVLRHAAESLGQTLDFGGTEALRALALTGRAGQKRELAGGLRAERTPRELRLEIAPESSEDGGDSEFSVLIPGEIVAPRFGLRVQVAAEDVSLRGRTAVLRNWSPGDRVRLRYSSGPRKVKEVLERLRVTGTGRSRWPVLEVDGRIAWMRGVELEPEQGIVVVATPLDDTVVGPG